jgi:hypothetical protein
MTFPTLHKIPCLQNETLLNKSCCPKNYIIISLGGIMKKQNFKKFALLGITAGTMFVTPVIAAPNTQTNNSINSKKNSTYQTTDTSKKARPNHNASAKNNNRNINSNNDNNNNRNNITADANGATIPSDSGIRTQPYRSTHPFENRYEKLNQNTQNYNNNNNSNINPGQNQSNWSEQAKTNDQFADSWSNANPSSPYTQTNQMRNQNNFGSYTSQQGQYHPSNTSNPYTTTQQAQYRSSNTYSNQSPIQQNTNQSTYSTYGENRMNSSVHANTNPNTQMQDRFGDANRRFNDYPGSRTNYGSDRMMNQSGSQGIQNNYNTNSQYSPMQSNPSYNQSPLNTSDELAMDDNTPTNIPASHRPYSTNDVNKYMNGKQNNVNDRNQSSNASNGRLTNPANSKSYPGHSCESHGCKG